ncbi:unnamed protein product, partial [Mesorhabditis belari]|uniref:Uncharacterized protein n=1 Tax=Mesorhabditis belari TaxID=2138241 RepID=A0AAF3F9U3_9BILA
MIIHQTQILSELFRVLLSEIGVLVEQHFAYSGRKSTTSAPCFASFFDVNHSSCVTPSSTLSFLTYMITNSEKQNL